MMKSFPIKPALVIQRCQPAGFIKEIAKVNIPVTARWMPVSLSAYPRQYSHTQPAKYAPSMRKPRKKPPCVFAQKSMMMGNVQTLLFLLFTACSRTNVQIATNKNEKM